MLDDLAIVSGFHADRIFNNLGIEDLSITHAHVQIKVLHSNIHVESCLDLEDKAELSRLVLQWIRAVKL